MCCDEGKPNAMRWRAHGTLCIHSSLTGQMNIEKLYQSPFSVDLGSLTVVESLATA